MQEIRRETVDLSLQIASKLIRKNLTPEDNDALIRESLGQNRLAALRAAVCPPILDPAELV